MSDVPRVTKTVEDTGAQTPFETVQIKVLVPVPRELTVEEGLLGEAMEAGPDPTDQAPLPTVGTTAFNVVEETHTVWFVPALDAG